MKEKDVNIKGVKVPMRNIREIKLVSKDGALCRRITYFDECKKVVEFVGMDEGYKIELAVRKYLNKR
jgi:hypothetical protein